MPRVDRAHGGAAVALALVLLLSGCLYGFTGGGLPRHIRTIAIVPFENATPQPLLSTEVELKLQEELPRNLGVRLVEASVADALVRGRITGFTETAPNIRAADPGGRADVVQQQIRIVVDAELYDAREDRLLWKNSSVSGVGEYQPDNEQFATGRTRAITDLVRKFIDGAQSQW